MNRLVSRIFARRCIFTLLSLACLPALSAEDGSSKIGRPPVFHESKVAKWLEFSEGPAMPLPNGISGAFIGVSGDVLIVAGGSFFSLPVSEGGKKEYRDDIYILRQHDGQAVWEHAGRLPRAAAHGGSVSTPDGVLCIGGENAERISSDVFLLRWDAVSKTVVTDETPPDLPDPKTYLSAAKLGDRVYVAGGRGPDKQELNSFQVLDLKAVASGWRNLPGWPGSARFGAVLAGQYVENAGFIYLFSGKTGDEYLKDGYRYNPREQLWQTVASPPRAVLLAPVLAMGQSRILIFSGSDGYKADVWQELGDQYCLPDDVLSYNTVTDAWAQNGRMPAGVAGTAAVMWNGKIVIPGGELRHGVRTPTVQIVTPLSVADNFGFLDQLALFTYLGGLAALCVWLHFRHRHQNTTENFYLAGRSLPGWAAGMSLMATAVSSIGFMAIPAKTFTADWTYFAGVFTWFVVIPIVVIAFVPFFRRINVSTAYELLETRFDVRVRIFGAVGFSLMEGGRMAIILLLPATALATVTPISIEQSILLMGIFATIYAVTAGMRGVVWTDVIQGIIMLFGAVLCVVIVLVKIDGGVGELLSIAIADEKFSMSLEWSPAAAGVWVVLVGNIFIRLSTLTSSQSSVQRLLSTPDEKQAVRALWMDVAVSVPWAVIVFLLGTALYVFYKSFPAAMPPQLQDIEVLPLFMSQQLPPGLSGIVIAAIFAAGMSSLDTSMHSLSTTWTRDFFGRFCPRYSDRVQLIVSKGLIILFGIIATGSALMIYYAGIRGMWDFFISLFGLFGGVLCGVFMLARFSKRANATGTLLGGLTSFVLMLIVWQKNIVHGLLYTAVGVVACMMFGYGFSLFFKSPGKTPDLPLKE